jgi:hypothetical protein
MDDDYADPSKLLLLPYPCVESPPRDSFRLKDGYFNYMGGEMFREGTTTSGTQSSQSTRDTFAFTASHRARFCYLSNPRSPASLYWPFINGFFNTSDRPDRVHCHDRKYRHYFQTLSKARLYLTAATCHVGYHSVTLLGRNVDRFGLSTTDERIAAIRKLEFPTTLRDLETFIGIWNYHREHIPYYARIVQGAEALKSDLLKDAPKQVQVRRAFTAT